MWITREAGSGPSAAHHRLEVHPLEQLHREVHRPVVGDAEIVELHGVRRSQVRRGRRLALEARRGGAGAVAAGGADHLRADQLDGGGPRQHAVRRAVDLAHAAAADQLAELVAAHLARLRHFLSELGDDARDHRRDRDEQVFINMLSWATTSLIDDGRSQSDIRQGVTLEVFGEGWSMGPINEMKREMIEQQGYIGTTIPWTTLGEYLEHLVRRGISSNVASFVAPPRCASTSSARRPRRRLRSELERMRALVRHAMEEVPGRRRVADLRAGLLRRRPMS